MNRQNKNIDNNKDYAIFIISYGRPDHVNTAKTLDKLGKEYTIILSDDDPSIEQYEKNFKSVIIFNKQKYIEKTDIFYNGDMRKICVYARNAVYDIAEKIGIRYFIVLDDDYYFFLKYAIKDKVIKGIRINEWDKYFSPLFNFYKNNENIKILSIAQTGDFNMTSPHNFFMNNKYKFRKAMNFYFCDTHRRVDFLGAINEDTTSYIYWGNKGDIFLTFPYLCLQQRNTQQIKGGLTETYKEFGTYFKSFMTILVAPAAVGLREIGAEGSKRIHHNVRWDYAVPKILADNYK